MDEKDKMTGQPEEVVEETAPVLTDPGNGEDERKDRVPEISLPDDDPKDPPGVPSPDHDDGEDPKAPSLDSDSGEHPEMPLPDDRNKIYPEILPSDHGHGAGPETPPPGYGSQGQPETPPPGYSYGGPQGTPPPGHGYGPGYGPQGYGPQGPGGPGYGPQGYGPQGPGGPGYGPQGYPPRHAPQKNNMALASLIVGVLSILLCCCGGFGVILGAVGVVLAILSRGREPMENNAKIGLGLSIGGIVLGIAVLIMAFAMVGSDEFRSQMYQNSYGTHGDYSHYFEHGDM